MTLILFFNFCINSAIMLCSLIDKRHVVVFYTISCFFDALMTYIMSHRWFPVGKIKIKNHNSTAFDVFLLVGGKWEKIFIHIPQATDRIVLKHNNNNRKHEHHNLVKFEKKNATKLFWCNNEIWGHFSPTKEKEQIVSCKIKSWILD